MFTFPSGMILIWSGAIVNIPAGYVLCDGNNGTPDLRNRFVVGAGDTYAVDASGGAINHTHNFTGDGHFHTHPAGSGMDAGAFYLVDTSEDPTTGTTDNANGLPPYYALAYIMKT